MPKSDTGATKSESSSIIKNESEFERYEREYLERESEKTGESTKETEKWNYVRMYQKENSICISRFITR